MYVEVPGDDEGVHVTDQEALEMLDAFEREHGETLGIAWGDPPERITFGDARERLSRAIAAGDE